MIPAADCLWAAGLSAYWGHCLEAASPQAGRVLPEVMLRLGAVGAAKRHAQVYLLPAAMLVAGTRKSVACRDACGRQQGTLT